MITFFNITAIVPGIGRVMHIIRAETQAEAWGRDCRAHPDTTPVLTDVRQWHRSSR